MLKRLGLITLVAIGLSQGATSLAQNEPMHPRLLRARSVAIEFEKGPDLMASAPTTDDRAAMYAVRKELERSKRYSIVNDRRNADILIAVRVRAASRSSGPKSIRRDGLTFRGESPARADVLLVYDAQLPQRTIPIWRGMLVDGLSGDQPPLLETLLADIDRHANGR